MALSEVERLVEPAGLLEIVQMGQNTVVAYPQAAFGHFDLAGEAQRSRMTDEIALILIVGHLVGPMQNLLVRL